MSMDHPVATPLPVGAAIAPRSLRASMEARRARGERFSLAEAIAMLVPLCLDARQRHAAGERPVVHPSSIVLDEGGQASLDGGASGAAPTLPRDRAVLAPEARSGATSTARSTVYAIAAMLYELLTGESVGPGMRRPTEIVPQLPAALEVLLARALVSEPEHRPDDLGALAQALHNMAPHASIAPPPADTSSLEGDEFEIDVRLSMMPPAPAVPSVSSVAASSGYGVAVAQRAAPRNDPTTRLADLKARLESDPRPRYIVLQDGMDHGPFTAVELLQQIASNKFDDANMLRDSLSKEERPIRDWDEFAPFAEQAKLHREIKAEKVELEKVIVAESKATKGKALVGGVGLVVLVGVVGAVVLKARGTRDDSVTIEGGGQAVNVEVDGGVKAGNAQAKPGQVGGRLPSAGGVPVLPGGMSCEGAQAKYVEEMKMGEKGQADLTQGQFAAVLNNGSYLNGCGVPESTAVNICAAVQNGRAVGVTVTMTPASAAAQACVAARVRGLSFPSNPKLDIARTTFK